jgi:hypothetical protein
VEKNKRASNLTMQFKIGLENFTTCLTSFIDSFQKIGIDIDDLSTISLFKKLHLPDSTIAHSDNSYYGKPEFSNVAIRMGESQNDEYISDEIYCYAQATNYISTCYVIFLFFLFMLINFCITDLTSITYYNKYRKT